MTSPDGTTPSAPDVDQPDGGSHDDSGDTAGRTPGAPDQAEGDES
jgi:hypothetical protein